MIRTVKFHFYRWKLERLIRKRARSFEVEQYRRHRKAALKHTPKVWAS